MISLVYVMAYSTGCLIMRCVASNGCFFCRSNDRFIGQCSGNLLMCESKSSMSEMAPFSAFAVPSTHRGGSNGSHFRCSCQHRLLFSIHWDAKICWLLSRLALYLEVNLNLLESSIPILYIRYAITAVNVRLGRFEGFHMYHARPVGLEILLSRH